MLRQMLQNAIEPCVQLRLDSLVQFDAPLGHPSGLPHCRVIAGEGSKGGKLRRPVSPGHGRVRLGDVVRQIYDIIILSHNCTPLRLVAADLVVAHPGRSSLLQIQTL